MLHIAWTHLSTYPLYTVFDLHLSCMLENERPFDTLTLPQRMLDADKHDM
jgi:hypothetical protein